MDADFVYSKITEAVLGSTFGLANEMKKLAEEFLEWRQSLC